MCSPSLPHPSRPIVQLEDAETLLLNLIPSFDQLKDTNHKLVMKRNLSLTFAKRRRIDATREEENLQAPWAGP